MQKRYGTLKTLFAYLAVLMIPTAIVGIVQLCNNNTAIGFSLLIGGVVLLFVFGHLCSKYTDKEKAEAEKNMTEEEKAAAKAREGALQAKKQAKAEPKRQEKARKSRTRSDAVLPDGTVCCTPKTLLRIIKCLDYVNLFSDGYCICPICNAKLKYKYDYVLQERIQSTETISGVYVASTITGRAAPAWQYVNQDKEFPAVDTSCPNCEYHVFLSKVSGYREHTTDVYYDFGERKETSETTYDTWYRRAIDLGKLPYESLQRLKRDRSVNLDQILDRSPRDFVPKN